MGRTDLRRFPMEKKNTSLYVYTTITGSVYYVVKVNIICCPS